MPASELFRDMLARSLLALPALQVSLHSADPGTAGAGEISGARYRRQDVTLDRIAPGTVGNQNILEYNALPECTVSHFGLWSEGRFLTGGVLPASLRIGAGQSLRWLEAELIIRMG